MNTLTIRGGRYFHESLVDLVSFDDSLTSGASTVEAPAVLQFKLEYVEGGQFSSLPEVLHMDRYMRAQSPRLRPKRRNTSAAQTLIRDLQRALRDMSLTDAARRMAQDLISHLLNEIKGFWEEERSPAYTYDLVAVIGSNSKAFRPFLVLADLDTYSIPTNFEIPL